MSDAARSAAVDSIRQGVLSGVLDPRIALECILLVEFGLRRAAIVTIPAELPEGDILGAQVDYEFRARLAGQPLDVKTRLSDVIQRKKMSPVAFKAYLLRSSFENNVVKSAAYVTHRRAAEALGLLIMESEVRPTIREWYITHPEDGPALKTLLKRRHEIQTEMRRRYKSTDPVDRYIYPEERDPEHLRALGGLLGYPDCCVASYLAGRVTEGGTESETPEQRAARQLGEPRGGTEPAPTEAYWLKDFFPCRPECSEAAARGHQARQALAAIDPKLGEMYDEIRRRNVARVRTGPEIIREHEDWLRTRD